MNEFSDLEAELKRLRPAAASAELATRVEQAMAQPATATPSGGILPRRATTRFNWLTLGLGVTAAAALFLLLRPNVERVPQERPAMAFASPSSNSTTIPQTRALVPDGLTRVVYHTRDEGLLYPRNSDQPVRRVRAHSRETLHWKDTRTGASLRVSYPTEDVDLIPVSGQ